MELKYIKDKDIWYHVEKRAQLTEPEAIATVLKHRKDIQTIEQVKTYLAGLRTLGITWEMASKSKSASNAGDMYEELAPYFPFKFTTNTNGERMYYNENGDRELTPIMNKDPDGFVASLQSQPANYQAIRQLYADSEVLAGLKKRPEFGKWLHLGLSQMYLDHNKQLDVEPELIAWDYDTPTFKRFNPDLIVEGPTPTWDQFLARLDFPEVFMAWVWGLFLPGHTGRQIMWLQGNGNDGKSAVLNALSDFYGRRNCASLTKDSENSNFFFSQVYGKGLVTYNDCKNRRLLSTGKIQNITGGDTVPIEFKNHNAFAARVYSKVLVASNPFPEIDFNRNNETSRFILLQVAQPKGPKDSKFSKRLVDEMYHLLFKCREIYPKFISAESDVDLQLPKELQDKMRETCASSESNYLQDFLLFECSLNPKYSVKRERLVEALKTHLVEQGQDMRVITNTLVALKDAIRELGVTQGRKSVGNKQINVYRGIKLVGDPDESN